jgi:hypothetical protein
LLPIVDFRDARPFNPMAIHHRPKAVAVVAILLAFPVLRFPDEA